MKVASRVLQVAGGCLFVFSFFLPAVTMLPDGGWGPHGPVGGFRCAAFAPFFLVSASMNFIGGSITAGQLGVGLLITLSGLVNPLVLIYVVAPFRMLAAVVVGCLVASTVATNIGGFKPLVGYFVWVAGVLLLLSRELARISSEVADS
jgi:hypothetical protein